MIRRPPRSPLFPSTPLFRPPTSASAMTRRISGVGRVTVSLRKSTNSCIRLSRLFPLRQQIRLDQGDGQVTRHPRSEEHTSELQSPCNLVCRLLLEKKKSSSL